MRESVISKTPYALILGDKERDNNTISYRVYGSEKTNTLSIEEFVDMIEKEIKDMKRKEN